MHTEELFGQFWGASTTETDEAPVFEPLATCKIKRKLYSLHLQSTQLRSAQLLAVITHIRPLQVQRSWGKAVCAVPHRNRHHT
jgi:hypothetical protein